MALMIKKWKAALADCALLKFQVNSCVSDNLNDMALDGLREMRFLVGKWITRMVSLRKVLMDREYNSVIKDLEWCIESMRGYGEYERNTTARIERLIRSAYKTTVVVIMSDGSKNTFLVTDKMETVKSLVRVAMNNGNSTGKSVLINLMNMCPTIDIPPQFTVNRPTVVADVKNKMMWFCDGGNSENICEIIGN